MYLQGNLVQTSVLRGFDQGRTIDRWVVTVECKVQTCVNNHDRTIYWTQWSIARLLVLQCHNNYYSYTGKCAFIRIPLAATLWLYVVGLYALVPFWESAPGYYVWIAHPICMHPIVKDTRLEVTWTRDRLCLVSSPQWDNALNCFSSAPAFSFAVALLLRTCAVTFNMAVL